MYLLHHKVLHPALKTTSIIIFIIIIIFHLFVASWSFTPCVHGNFTSILAFVSTWGGSGLKAYSVKENGLRDVWTVCSQEGIPVAPTTWFLTVIIRRHSRLHSAWLCWLQTVMIHCKHHRLHSAWLRWLQTVMIHCEHHRLHSAWLYWPQTVVITL